MGNKTTNQKKGIVTRGSGHIAESSGASLPYFQKPFVGNVMDDNHVETAKCAIVQSARRTFIEGHNVLHHESKIGFPFGGPSRYDRPHSFAQKAPPAYQWFAEPIEKSPDTKVEGKWIVRSFDKTLQDNRNGPGKFSPGLGRTEILDESELLFQQCAVEKIKLECADKAEEDSKKIIVRSTMAGELHVYIGDTVKVTAYRVNASETDPEKRRDVHCHISLLRKKKNPPAEETRHAAFVLTRNGRSAIFGIMGDSWDEIKNKTLVGQSTQIAVEGSKKMAKVSVLELKEDWLLAADETNLSVGPFGGDYGSYDTRQDGKDISNDPTGPSRDQARHQRSVKSANSQVNRAKKKRKRNNSKPGAIANAKISLKKAGTKLERYNREALPRAAERTANAKASKSNQSKVRLLLDGWNLVQAYFFKYQPLRIDIEAHGCSPGANAVVKAYPKEEFGAELASLWGFPGVKHLKTTMSLVTKISDFFKKIKRTRLREIGKFLGSDPGGDFNIDLYFFRHKKSKTKGNSTSDEDMAPSIELEFQWKKLYRDSNPGDGETRGLKSWEIHRSWKLDAKLERLLGLVIQFEVDLNACLGIGKVITDILKFLGVKTGVFLDINVGLSVGIGGTVSWDEYGKAVWKDWKVINVPLKAVIQMSLVVRVGRFFEVGFRLTGRWEPKFRIGHNNKKQVCLIRTAKKFELVLTFEAKVDILGWDLDASYEIDKWEFEIDGSAIPIFGEGT